VNAGLRLPLSPAEEQYRDQYADAGCSQGDRPDFLQADVDVDDMPQGRGGHHGRDDDSN
jgi:hypothetical protein